MAQRTLVASGTVTVRHVGTGREWDEAIEVFEEDMVDAMGVEDAAAYITQEQTPEDIEVLDFDLS